METNPGPSVVDPNQTILAPHHQGDPKLGGNAGRQCVAIMPFVALIYNHTNNICLSDLIAIMNASHNLYSKLWLSSEEDFLLLTDRNCI